MIVREAVLSRSLASLGYDAATQTLEVAFLPNSRGVAAVWQYADVPSELIDEMDEHGSIGSFFHQRIKGKFAETKVATIVDGVETPEPHA